MNILKHKLIWIFLFSYSSMYMHCVDKPPVVKESPVKKIEPKLRLEPGKKVEIKNTDEQDQNILKIKNLISQLLQNKVYFEFDKYNLTDEAKTILAEAGNILKFDLNGVPISIMIEGHTDEVGTDQYNLALGERRAKSVKDYLFEYGVPEGQLQIISYGEESLMISNVNSEQYRKNRRAQIKIKNKPPLQ